MDHADHVRLLAGGVPATGGTWADLGAGDGAFTLALAELIGPAGVIHAVDRDRGALRELERHVARDAATVHTLVADFTRPLALPPLDGIVMANSLKFVTPRQGHAWAPTRRREHRTRSGSAPVRSSRGT